MEPKLPTPNRGSEHLPPTFSRVENAPVFSSPERALEHKIEAERVKQQVTSAEPTNLVLPPPVPLTPQVDDTATVVSDDTTPLAAADDDLIEKEWVDKAKEIIVKTKDDPYQREREVGKLQADYLRKRYGKELGAA